MSFEEKNWRRLLRDLDAHPVGDWEVFGLLGEPELYPLSLYKLYVHWGKQTRWWCAERTLGQCPKSFDPVGYQGSIGWSGLPLDRVVYGRAGSQLQYMKSMPGNEALGRLLGEFQRRLPKP